MVNEVAYIFIGAFLWTIGYRVKDESPKWIINIWGLVAVLTGIGFFAPFAKNHSFIPMAMISCMVFFKGSNGFLKPVFFLGGISFLVYPTLSAFGGLSVNPLLVLFTIISLVLIGMKQKAFNVPLDPPALQRPLIAARAPVGMPKIQTDTKPQEPTLDKPSESEFVDSG